MRTRTFAGAVFFWVTWASWAGAEPAVAEASDAPRFSFAVVPLTNYSSDTGIGFGVRGMVQRLAPAWTPYQMSLELQAYMTTGGVQFHFLSLDLPRVAGSAYRLDFMAGYYRDVAAPYYGVGNHGAPAAGQPAAYYLYDEQSPLVRLRLRRTLVSHLSAIVGYRFMSQTVRADPSSLLAEQSPFGIGGGRFGELSAGLVWDTRDQELTPRHGVLLEATARSTQTFLGSSYASFGTFASASAYRELRPRVVLAGRLALDASFGDVPFDRLQDFGSLVTPFYNPGGVGGALSVRGLFQSEYIGKTKAVGNLELRYQFLTLNVLRHEVLLTAVGFADAGRVWDGADPPVLADAGIHAGGGGGLRIGWGENFVLRADAGFAEGRARVYADFRHIF